MKNRSTILLACAVFLGCAPTPNETEIISHQEFDRPQAMVFVDGTLLVTESGYGQQGWRPGHVSAIDPDTASVLGRWTTSQLNPQRIRTHGDSIFVVSSGSFDFSDFDNPRAITGGGVDVLSKASIHTDQPVVENWPLPLPVDSSSPNAPIDLGIAGDRILITSGLRSSVWLSQTTQAPIQFDEVSIGQVNGLGLGAVASWGDRFVIVDFNSDRVSLVDSTGAVSDCHAHIGADEIAIEGSQSPIVDGDELYVLMSLSGRVIALDLNTLVESCTVESRVVVPSTGQVPNDMHLREDTLFIVNSGDNNVIAYNSESGSEIRRWVLPVGSNPWHIAFDPNRPYMAVSEWGANAVSIIDLQTGAIRRVTETMSTQSFP
jgi:hypothetical protein